MAVITLGVMFERSEAEFLRFDSVRLRKEGVPALF